MNGMKGKKDIPIFEIVIVIRILSFATLPV